MSESERVSGREAPTDLRPGDVVRYSPAVNHCREGMAFVTERGTAVDTFWASFGDGQSHALSLMELESVEVLFNVGDYEKLDRYSAASRETWETFAPDDRAMITSQHGLQELLFVRKGAVPDLPTQTERAKCRVEKAEADLRSAQGALDRRRDELAALESEHVDAV